MANRIQFFVDEDMNLIRYFVLEGELSDESSDHLDQAVARNDRLLAAHSGATFKSGSLEFVTDNVQFVIYEDFNFRQASLESIRHLSSISRKYRS